MAKKVFHVYGEKSFETIILAEDEDEVLGALEDDDIDNNYSSTWEFSVCEDINLNKSHANEFIDKDGNILDMCDYIEEEIEKEDTRTLPGKYDVQLSIG